MNVNIAGRKEFRHQFGSLITQSYARISRLITTDDLCFDKTIQMSTPERQATLQFREQYRISGSKIPVEYRYNQATYTVDNLRRYHKHKFDISTWANHLWGHNTKGREISVYGRGTASGRISLVTLDLDNIPHVPTEFLDQKGLEFRRRAREYLHRYVDCYWEDSQKGQHGYLLVNPHEMDNLPMLRDAQLELGRVLNGISEVKMTVPWGNRGIVCRLPFHGMRDGFAEAFREFDNLRPIPVREFVALVDKIKNDPERTRLLVGMGHVQPVTKEPPTPAKPKVKHELHQPTTEAEAGGKRHGTYDAFAEDRTIYLALLRSHWRKSGRLLNDNELLSEKIKAGEFAGAALTAKQVGRANRIGPFIRAGFDPSKIRKQGFRWDEDFLDAWSRELTRQHVMIPVPAETERERVDRERANRERHIEALLNDEPLPVEVPEPVKYYVPLNQEEVYRFLVAFDMSFSDPNSDDSVPVGRIRGIFECFGWTFNQDKFRAIRNWARRARVIECVDPAYGPSQAQKWQRGKNWRHRPIVTRLKKADYQPETRTITPPPPHTTIITLYNRYEYEFVSCHCSGSTMSLPVFKTLSRGPPRGAVINKLTIFSNNWGDSTPTD